MTKQEYLLALQAALSVELSKSQVDEQIRYYRQYIDDQMAGGRTEAEILEELGDARIIAHNIIDGVEEEGNTYHWTTTTYTSYSGGDEADRTEPTWKTRIKIYGVISLIFVILFAVLALITQLIIWLLPSIIVIGLVLWILRKLGGR